MFPVSARAPPSTAASWSRAASCGAPLQASKPACHVCSAPLPHFPCQAPPELQQFDSPAPFVPHALQLRLASRAPPPAVASGPGAVWSAAASCTAAPLHALKPACHVCSAPSPQLPCQAPPSLQQLAVPASFLPHTPQAELAPAARCTGSIVRGRSARAYGAAAPRAPPTEQSASKVRRATLSAPRGILASGSWRGGGRPGPGSVVHRGVLRASLLHRKKVFLVAKRAPRERPRFGN